MIGGSEPPVRPEWLVGDAAIEWDRVVGELTRSQLVTPLDVMTLAAYCKTYSLWRRTDKVLEEEGPLTVDSNGNVRAHPAAKLCLQMFAELRRMAAEFGFSPAARSRIDTPKPQNQEDADFDEFESARPTGTE